MDLIQSVRTARRVSVPEIYIRTPDPIACIEKLRKGQALLSFKDGQEVALIKWNVAAGYEALNPAGSVAIARNLPIVGTPPAGNAPTHLQQQWVNQCRTATVNTTLALGMCEKFPEYTVVFFIILTPSEFFKDPIVVQLLYSLRDELAKKGKCLILIGPHFPLPPALAGDVLILTDPYPLVPELRDIITERQADLKKDNPQVKDLTDEEITKAALNMQGLTQFAASTAISLSFSNAGVNYEELKEQRYARIDEVPSLKVYRGDASFERLKAMAGAQRLLLRYGRNPRHRPGCVVFIDEIGLTKTTTDNQGQDTSGTAGSLLAGILKYMEKRRLLGALLVGLPGTGKTAIAEALGNALEIPTLEMSPDDMLDRWVGSSQQNQLAVFNTIDAIAGRNPLFLASTNSTEHLPPPLLRRFSIGQIYFDQPYREEKDAIWLAKMGYYEIPDQPLPNDDGWMGAEIDKACRSAWLLDCSLVEAAESIIPITKVRPNDLYQMRELAHERYLDARTGKPFDKNRIVEEQPVEKGGSRRIFTEKERGH